MTSSRFYDRAPLAGALVLLAGLFLAACTSSRFATQAPRGDEALPPDSTLAYTIFLIGDAGAPAPGDPVLALLNTQLEAAGEEAAVVFLGDNVYPDGLPPVGHPLRSVAEERLDHQLDAVKDTEARIVFLPGNHDWGGDGLGGNLDRIIQQERYVEAALDRGDTFMPDRGFPGPVDVVLNDSLVLVVLDTQWWLQESKDYSDTDLYELEGELDLLIQLDDVLRRHTEAGRRVVVAGHHPMFSNGSHGGRFVTYRRIPIVPLSRRYLGTPQDLSNLKYRRLRDALLAVFEQHPGLVYAAGHDHNLQYFRHDDQHYIVSGAGTKQGPVASGHGASFVSDEKGFATLRYYDDGAVWLTYWAPGEEDGRGVKLFEARIEGEVYTAPPPRPVLAVQAEANETPIVPDTTRLEAPPVQAERPETPELDGDEAPYVFAVEDSVRDAIAPRYASSGLKKFFFGGHYRDVWATEVDIPVLDLDETAGGLTVIKKGGGLQTVSLRLQGADGDEYVLRSVDKRTERSLPSYLLETVAQDIVQDQTAAMFPFGAFIIPPLAEAAGVLHTHPRLVVIPDSPRLGQYREEFAGLIALFETRPDEEQTDEERFGYAPDIIGSPRMFEKTQEDNDFRVVEPEFARARLLDMLIGDWDRHKDQWRWAEYEPFEVDSTLEGEARTQGKRYLPIPRDRDFAFFRFDGPLAALAHLTGNTQFRRLSKFDDDFGDLFGLNYNGAALDRQFTSSLTREDWVAAARQLQAAMTDSVIEAAVATLPPEIYRQEGEDFVAALKSRRDALHEAASGYYDLLARNVDVIGSDKHERFDVHHRPDGTTEVVMYKTSKEGEVDRELFRRVFLPGETDEIRLYGRAGNDTFVFTGEVDRAIVVRAIGDAGQDTFVDESDVGGGRTRHFLYDDPGDNTWQLGPSSRAHRTYDEGLNTYVPTRFELTEYAPVPLFGYNGDDGFILGGGLRIRTHGWRTSPYASQHTILGDYALRTRSFDVRYNGIQTRVSGAWDRHLDARVLAQAELRNYYGLGNETQRDDEGLYQGSLLRASFAPALVKRGIFVELEVGPRFEYAHVEPPADFPETGEGLGFDARDLQDTYLVGARAAFNVDGTDTLAATQAGIRWLNAVEVNAGVRANRDVFARFSSELAYFYTFYRNWPVTLALRAGGATIVGDFPFYHANTLGGEANLRGFAKTRFAGRSSVFTNAELRLPIFDFNAYLTRGEVGLLGFYDRGRVWADGEDSGVWHQGYGAGLWVTPFYQLAITSSVGFSDEGRRFNVSLGFLF